MTGPRRVVLLGGGYVTVYAYRTLARRLRREIARGDLEIVVISADDAHNFHGFTGEVLARILPYQATRTPLAEACPRARVIRASVRRVDPHTRTVTYRPVTGGPSRRIRYDEVVVGLGGREPVESVPGLAEHGYALRAPGDLSHLSARLTGLIESARLDLRESTVVVVGGGLAGVEMAAAISDAGAHRLRVVLVHGGDRLLPELAASQPRLVRYAERQLTRHGIEVRLGTRLVSVTEHGAFLADGSFILAGTVLATVGQAPVTVPGLEPLPHDDRGRLETTTDLRGRGQIGGLWAAGDAARVAHVRTGEPVPANALWAIKAGAHVGRNLARVLRGRPPRRFRYLGLGQAASFGLGCSVAELYRVPFTGVVAWLLRVSFFARFMPSRRRAVRVLGQLARAVATGHRVTAAPAEPRTAGRPALTRAA